MTARETYRILLLGDIHFGESYANAGARQIQQRGYLGGLEHLQRFTAAADTVVANLETPLVNPDEHASPMAEVRPYLHWANPKQTVGALHRIGVDAVSLANNHMLDRDVTGLRTTMENLRSLGMSYFGAGETIDDADQPFRITLPERVGSGHISIQGSFAVEKQKRQYGFYADKETPGCAPISSQRVPLPDRSNGEDTLSIAYPHWGPNYNWRNSRQQRMAQGLLDNGYDLIVGHGAHCVQEIERAQKNWVIYGIGNGHFQASGRFKKYQNENGILPLSFWVMLEINLTHDDTRDVFLKLYPVYSDNRVTGFSPGPVTSADFDSAFGALMDQSANSGYVEQKEVTSGRDELGSYISLPLNDWPISQAPRALSSAHTSGESESSEVLSIKPRDANHITTDIELQFPDIPTGPVNTYEDPESQRVIDELSQYRRNIGSVVISKAAERDRASIEWFSRQVAVATRDNHRVLLKSHLACDTSVSAKIVKDKYLTKKILVGAGVPTPSGGLAEDAQSAVDIQQKLGKPVVIKPRNGAQGKGITVNVSSAADIRAAYVRASIDSSGVVVEEYIDGIEFRCLGNASECLGAVRRVLPNVMGDGTSSIFHLVEKKNEIRKLNPNNYAFPIPIDETMTRKLSRDGYTLDSVLEAGQRIIVRDVGGISGGGEALECLDALPEEVKGVAVQSIAAIPGMSWGGADILVARDTGLPYLLELNTNAAISNSTYPVYGVAKDLGEHAWREMVTCSEETRMKSAEAVAREMTIRDSPASIEDEVSTMSDTSIEVYSLARLLELYLEFEGWTVKKVGANIACATRAGDTARWFNGPLDSSVFSRVEQVVRDHTALMDILRYAGMRVGAVKRVRGQSELLEVLESWGTGGSLIPVTRGWAKRRELASVVDAQDVRPSIWNKSAQLIQKHIVGKRLRVIATQDEVLAILKHGILGAIDVHTLVAAAEYAVRAVRAVPGLRWAAVDIVVPELGGEELQTNNLVVEGVSLHVQLKRDDQIVVGSLQSVAAEFVYGSEGYSSTRGASGTSLIGGETAINVYEDPESQEVLREFYSGRRGLGALMIGRAAQKDGADITWLTKQDGLADLSGKRAVISGHACTESVLSARIVSDKQLTKELLKEAGVSIPRGRPVDSAEDTVLAQQELGCPVVVKPRRGHMGHGITVNITSPEDLRQAYDRALNESGGVLVEQYISGVEYRCHATDSDCVSVFQRLLPTVRGDGFSTVRDLVHGKNESRQANPTTHDQPIPLDDVAEGYLHRQELTWDSVLPVGKIVTVRDVNGITSGGDSEECLAKASDELKQVAIGSVAAIPGMSWGGSDILVEDGTGKPYVMEVNTDASISGPLFPVYGEPRDLARLVWQRISAAASGNVSGAPRLPSIGADPQHFSDVMPRYAGDELIPLSRMLRDRLSDVGYRSEEFGRRILKASRGSEVRWFADCASENDHVRSHRFIQSHGLLRILLLRSDIPFIRGRRVKTLEQVLEFREAVDTDVALHAFRRSQGRTPRLLGRIDSPDASLVAGRPVWIVQARPQGTRIRVIATPQGVLASFCEDMPERVSQEVVRRAGVLATEAVRAVPELRWSQVDILFSSFESGDRGVVEGMSVRPVFRKSDFLLCGSLDAVLSAVIDE